MQPSHLQRFAARPMLGPPLLPAPGHLPGSYASCGGGGFRSVHGVSAPGFRSPPLLSVWSLPADAHPRADFDGAACSGLRPLSAEKVAMSGSPAGAGLWRFGRASPRAYAGRCRGRTVHLRSVPATKPRSGPRPRLELSEWRVVHPRSLPAASPHIVRIQHDSRPPGRHFGAERHGRRVITGGTGGATSSSSAPTPPRGGTDRQRSRSPTNDPGEFTPAQDITCPSHDPMGLEWTAENFDRFDVGDSQRALRAVRNVTLWARIIKRS